MTGPEGNSEFCFPRISVFPETELRGTLRFDGSKIHYSTRDQSLNDLLYSKTKQELLSMQKANFEKCTEMLATNIRPPLITGNSGQHFAGNGELFPV